MRGKCTLLDCIYFCDDCGEPAVYMCYGDEPDLSALYLCEECGEEHEKVCDGELEAIAGEE